MAEECSAALEGPVMSLLSKKLRALRKKQKRILQMESALAEGKILNKEQSDVLKSKPSVEILIDEYERLRLPLSSALHDELQLSKAIEPSKEPLEPSKQPLEPSSPSGVEDLLKLLYFATLFDVKPQGEYTATMLSRTHERSSCLTYDYVTDDDSEMLGESDLDAIASLGSLLSSRPLWSVNSHHDAIRACFLHARLWLDNSDQPILPGSNVTYAGLRGRLNKIMASDYFSMTPAIRGSDDLAAAAEKYTTTCLVQIPEGSTGLTDETVESPGVEIDGDVMQYQEKDEEPENQQAKDENDQSGLEDDSPTVEDPEVLNPTPEGENVHYEQQNPEPDVEHDPRGENQYREHHFPRRSYQNQRGGGRGGGRRGYQNGRGGRSGRSAGGDGYQNSRSQYYDSGYYPRNYHQSRGRRGGRYGGGSVMYTNHQGHGPGNTEVQAGA